MLKTLLLLTLSTAAFGQPKERGPVKLLTDGFTPGPAANATVADLQKLKLGAKWSAKLPRQAVERNVFRVSGFLTGAFVESDSDFHLIIEDNGKSFIAEIPKPEYGNPKYAATFKVERLWVEHAIGFYPKKRRLKKPIPVTVTGVFFVDMPNHNGLGHAPNEGELHPLSSIEAARN